eukprot:TRINITY_DN41650_c0_g1_i1.p1 TRINITY_DN41650_c0_g1~~TRINITY_DN41650_c0_g1_i1.p1  ORF type:complete len:461 (-),score=50.09 TRINITY_DN41650_c0_g1_i1:89-1471(-)
MAKSARFVLVWCTRLLLASVVLALEDCDVEVASGLSEAKFKRDYQGRRPVLIRRGAADWSARDTWNESRFVERYGALPVTLQDRKSVYTKGTGAARIVSKINVSQYVSSLSNHSLPIFENGHLPLGNRVRADFPPTGLAVASIRFTRIVSIGGKNTGVGLHGHGENWLAQLRGRKRWFLLDPNFNDDGPHPEEVFGSPCNYKGRRPTHWKRTKDYPKVCTAHAGDILYMPKHWLHSTCNLDTWTLGIGGQSDIKPHSAAELAVLDGDDATIHRIADRSGPIVFQKQTSKYSPASLAGLLGNVSTLALLKQLGVRFDDHNVFSSVMHEAASTGHVSALKWLLKEAPPDAIERASNSKGDSLFHAACATNQINIVKLLLKMRSAPSVRDAQGSTALHIAAKQGDTRIVKLLAKHGPKDLKARNNKGQTPEQLARALASQREPREGCKEVAELLADLSQRSEL